MTAPGQVDTHGANQAVAMVGFYQIRNLCNALDVLGWAFAASRVQQKLKPDTSLQIGQKLDRP